MTHPSLATDAGTTRVGIGLPVLNGGAYLAESLESLLAQTYGDFELVVSDNGSTDDTEEICREFARRDDRVRYLRTTVNRGAAWNYEHVFRETTGPYFRWATHDDLLDPTNLARCVEVMDGAPPDVVLVYPKTRLVDGAGAPLSDYEDNLDVRQRSAAARMSHVVRHIVMSNATYGLFRRSALERTRLLGGYPSSDYVLMAEVALVGQIWEIPERLFARRVHDEMSRKASPTAADAAVWFSGTPSTRPPREFTRVFLEHFRAIHRAPLPVSAKALCYASFLESGLRRYRRRMWWELRPQRRAA